jgi:polar amino acid transport system substrate-binding protein
MVHREFDLDGTCNHIGVFEMKKILICLFLFSIMFSVNANAQQLTIYTEEFPPFNFTEKGKITGVSTEVVQHVMANTGIPYLIRSLPWDQSYSLAQNQADTLIFSISRNSSREALFKWIGILTPTTYSVLALKSRTDVKISRLEDMKKYKVGTTTDDIVESWLIGKGFSTSDLFRSSGDNAALKNFKNLLNNRIDLWPFPDAVAYYIARQEGHGNPESLLEKAFSINELSGGYYMATSLSTSDAVVMKISQALKNFKQSDDYFKILAHWGVDAMGLKTDAPIAKLIYAFRNFNKIINVGYLATDKISAHRAGGLYRKEMREPMLEEYVGSFDQWLEKYHQMQGKVDALIIGDMTDIKGWNAEKARQHTQSQTEIPTGCVLGSVTDYAMFGFDGDDFIINMKIANSLGRTIPKSYIRKATRIIE